MTPSATLPVSLITTLGRKSPEEVEFPDAINPRCRLRRPRDDSPGHADGRWTTVASRISRSHRRSGELSLQGHAIFVARGDDLVAAGTDRRLSNLAARTQSIDARSDRGHRRDNLPECLSHVWTFLFAQGALPGASNLGSSSTGNARCSLSHQRRQFGGTSRSSRPAIFGHRAAPGRNVGGVTLAYLPSSRSQCLN